MKDIDIALCEMDKCQELLRNLAAAAVDVQGAWDQEDAYLNLNYAIEAAEYFLKER